MSLHRRTRVSLLGSRLLTVAICLLLFGCTGPAAGSDSTPPTLGWNVFERDSGGTGGTDYGANSSGLASYGHEMGFTLRAKDPEGIQSMDIGGSATWMCKSGDVGTNRNSHYAEQKHTFAPTADGKVLTEWAALLQASTNFDCPSGATFVGGTITLIGHASNYFAGVASGTLSVKIGAPCPGGTYC